MKYVEGVPYYRYLLRFTTLDGKRYRWVRWSPGAPWVYSEVERELADRGFTPEQLRRCAYSLELAPCV